MRDLRIERPDAPSNDECRDLYAHFGLAYYQSECLHRNVALIYVFGQMTDGGQFTRLRVDEALRRAFLMTFGTLVDEAQSNIPEHLKSDLARAKDRRDYLAHHFWYDRAHLMVSSDGVAAMIRELESSRDLFSEVSSRLEPMMDSLVGAVGLDEETLAQAWIDLHRGVIDEPLREQRMPNKQERVVAAYVAPFETAEALVLETEDGVLWEIGPDGLSWSRFDEPSSDWRESEPIKPFLPAQIAPRPELRGRWNYDLSLGRNRRLRISRTADATYSYSIVGPHAG